MENQQQQKKRNDYYTIDLLLIFKALWSKVWIIAIAGILAGIAGFCIAAFAIAPTYSASVMLYVNNTAASHDPNSTISSSQISAAQSLVKTYTEILKNRTTLNQVIKEAEIQYTYKDLYNMIKAAPSNDTEIMKVTVTTEDPDEAAKIANTIAEVLPERIKDVIEGAKMNVVEYAEPDTNKVAPSITKYTLVGIIIGVLLAVVSIAVSAMMDDTLHDEEFITQNYTYPILARIPDLANSTGKGKKYGYYYQNHKYGYYQDTHHEHSHRESETKN